jgi:hypothetical protein
MLELLTAEQALERELLWTEGRKIVQNAPQLYISVDVEADGIAGHGSLLEIGAQSPFGESFSSELRPWSKKFEPGQKRFCDEHGLERERLLREAPYYKKVMRDFRGWTESLAEKYDKPPVMVVANEWFDFSLIDYHFLKTYNGVWPWNPFRLRALALGSLAQGLSRNWDWTENRMGRLPRLILPDRNLTHRALADAQDQQLIHFGLAALRSKNPQS